MPCDPRELVGAAACIQCGVPDGMKSSVLISLLCQIAENGGSGGGVPSGVILMWSGSIATIPAGWVLCDGSNSTPDLRNRFVVAANADSAGVANTTIRGAPTQSGGAVVTEIFFPETVDVVSTPAAGPIAPDINTFDGVASTGLGSEVDFLPPFYALAYIMKT